MAPIDIVGHVDGGCAERVVLVPADEAPTSVIVIDNVPSQANRLEEALRRHRESIKIPELVLDLSDVGNLPAHLPRRLSSLGVLAMLSVAPALHAQSNCSSGTAVSNPTRNPGLVADCEALLTALDDLRGTSLNWSGEPVDAVQAYRAARHDHQPRVDGASRTR